MGFKLVMEPSWIEFEVNVKINIRLGRRHVWPKGEPPSIREESPSRSPSEFKGSKEQGKVLLKRKQKRYPSRIFLPRWEYAGLGISVQPEEGDS